MSWQPDSVLIAQLTHILAGTLSPDSGIRVEATTALEQAKQQPEFNNYLDFLLVTQDAGIPIEVRASAGITLKNNLSNDFTRNLKNNSYLLDNILKGLFDSNKLVRNITGNVITSLFGKLGVSHWPSLLPQLIELTETGSIINQEGAISALSKICEDSIELLNITVNGEKPLEFMIPKFINLTTNESNLIKAESLNCLSHIFKVQNKQILDKFMDSFLTRLFELANTSDPTVVKYVCRSFSTVIENNANKLLPHFNGLINFALHIMCNFEPKIALEGSELLLELVTQSFPEELFKPFLANIVPILLKCMVYTEMDIMMLEDEDDDANEEDKDEDIKPTMTKSKLHSITKNGLNQNGEVNNDDDEDDDGEDDDDSSLDWTLRKSSAATLDVLSSIFPEEVIGLTLPILKENISNDNWPIKEGAILAFGAIAESGIELFANQLPSLIPFLVESLKNPAAPVRQITCWTLSRYGSWICLEALNGGSCSNYFQPTFESIIKCTLDSKKSVQESATSSLSQFIEVAAIELLQPFDKILLNNFSICFNSYKRKNLIILYDAIQTFVEKIELDDESLNILLPPLIHKWSILKDDDKELWPLLECMSSVAVSLGERFAPYAVEVYQRAKRILKHCIEYEKNITISGTGFDNVLTLEIDFMITSLDLISGLVQGLATHSNELVEDDTIQLVIETFNNLSNDVRQSAFALLGDLAMNIPNKIEPSLEKILIAIGREIVSRDYENYPVVNNAVWALGEISLKFNLTKYLDSLVGILIDLMNSPEVEPTVLENCAVTIGRIGLSSPEFFAVHLSEFILNWVSNATYLTENEEKESAFQGICKIVMSNPTDVPNPVLVELLNAITLYMEPTNELAEAFHNLLHGYKSLLGDNWTPLFATTMNPAVLQHKYAV